MAAKGKMLSTAVVRWRLGDEPRITVVAKATFALSPSGVASIVDPEPIVDDVHHDGNEGRSLALASERAPRKTRAELLVFASAYAPPGERVARRTIRVGVLSGQTKTLLDKSLTVLGARRVHPLTRATSAPEPFERMPLRWELAFGGARSPDNPVGVGLDSKDKSAPSIVSDAGAKIAAGLGPIDPRWPARARKLAGASVSGERPALPADFDFGFFDAAPDDQRLREIVGDETVILVGLHPTVQEVRCALPDARASASLRVGDAFVDVPLVCDTMSIQGDALTCSLVWRGDVAMPPALAEGDVEIRATLRAFEPPATKAADVPARPAPTPKAFKQTQQVITHAAITHAAITHAAIPPAAPRSARSVFGTTMETATPFVFPDVVPPPPVEIAEARAIAPAEPAPRAIAASSTMTFASLPSLIEAVPESTTASSYDGRFDPPARTGDLVPIVDTSPYASFAFTTQLEPPQEMLVVVVKGTFDLGDGGATLAAEQMLPAGDVHEGDDAKASLRYASDFVPFKPRADVMLVGSAPCGAEGNVAFVTLVVGKLERRLAVFGDRRWRTSGAATEPERFDRMPLRWERALGGPLSKENPIGIGHGTATLVPNLEDPERLLDHADAVVPPTCFAPVPRHWRARASKLGTYDKKWLRTRWPYFPEDFDPSYFNAAPREQQVPHLEGGERFRITGVADRAFNGKVPDGRPRVFAQRTREAGGDLVEVRMRLDTLWFDVDARKLVVVWRGFVAVEDDDSPDLSLVYVAKDDDVDRPMKLPEARKRLHAALVARELVKPSAAVDVEPANDGPMSLRTAYARVQASKAPPAVEAGVEVPRAPKIQPDALLAAVRAEKSLAGMDFTGVDLSDLDLAGADLSGAILARARLSRTKLDGAKLRGAVLAGAAGESPSFVGADLSRADLSDVELDHADFSRAILHDAVLSDGKFLSSTFGEAKADRASFVRARLVGATFKAATLGRAELTSAVIEDASFVDAVLADARLYDAEGRAARFDRAKMKGLRADGAKLGRAFFADVDAPSSTWDGADLSDAVFQDGKLVGASFSRAILERAVFLRTDAREVNFRRARLRRAKMNEANLAQAIFERAILDGADLRGANLYQAETWKSSVSSVRLELAFLAGTKLA